MSIDVVATRDLVACKESQLLKIADKHGVSERVAGYVRRHWTRRVTNKCVHCDTILHKTKKCPKCHKPVESPLDLLQGLPSKVVLIRTSCATCNREMSFRAGHILKVTQQHGFFRPPLDCPRCKAKKLKLKEKAKAQVQKKVKAKEIKRKPEASKPWYYEYMNDQKVENRPFKALEGLKIEK
jgi:hypothetical protein